MQVKSNIWFENDKNGFFGKGRVELLEQIGVHGSISAAAKAMKMSYKAAWDSVNEMNNLSDSPIVERETGGKGGGGTKLTNEGHSTIALYKELEAIEQKFWDSLRDVSGDASLLAKFAKRMTIRTSARNQLLCIVKTINATKLSAEIVLKLSKSTEIKVLITRKSLQDMNIVDEMKLFVILKSSWIKLNDKEIKNRDNNLPCVIEEAFNDSGIVEVTARLKDENALTISMKEDEFKELNLKIGGEAWVQFDPSNAILAI